MERDRRRLHDEEIEQGLAGSPDHRVLVMPQTRGAGLIHIDKRPAPGLARVDDVERDGERVRRLRLMDGDQLYVHEDRHYEHLEYPQDRHTMHPPSCSIAPPHSGQAPWAKAIGISN